MEFKTPRHPFLTAPTSYFEVFEQKPEGEEWHPWVQRLDWYAFNKLKKHPQFAVFWGRGEVYTVVVCTVGDFDKNHLRQVASDIYRGVYYDKPVDLGDRS